MIHSHGVNHQSGWVWPRGQRSWEGFAAHVGSAWVVDFDVQERRFSAAPAEGLVHDFADIEAPLSLEEEEERLF